MGKRLVCGIGLVAQLVCLGLVAGVGRVGASPGDRGSQLAFWTIQHQGKAYLLGSPARTSATWGTSPAAFDCSGLVWLGAHDSLGVDFPTVSQQQWLAGGNIAGAPWDTDLPVGSLLFLHDDNPDLGGGATHVSIYYGGGQAMDCYNEQFGCNVHDVTTDSYYRAHWLGATYPWGDSPVAGVVGPSVGGGLNGAGAVSAVLSEPGPTYRRYASPVVAWGDAAGAPIAFAHDQVGDKDAAALTTQQLSGLSQVFGWARALDEFVPYHMELAVLVVLIVYVCKIGLSVVRYLIGLSPF
jgi:hypothetical protein